MATKTEQDIAQFEALLRRLEKEYDQFLAGLQRREPAATENALLTIVKLYASRPIQNSALSFKYNSLVARYNSFKTVWTRRQREREEGRIVAPSAAHPAPIKLEPQKKVHTAADPAEYLASDPHREQRNLEHFYETYRRMRERSGESVAKLNPENFKKALAEQVAKIKREQGCESVLVRVVSDQGRTRIVAKPFRRRQERPENAS